MAGFIVPFIQANAPDLARYSLDKNFFWVTVLATTFGLILSFTRAKKLEGAGASKVGSVAIYILVATIGMQMNLASILSDPELFVLGLVRIGFHGSLMLLMAWWIKAPVFYMAVGSRPTSVVQRVRPLWQAHSCCATACQACGLRQRP